MLITIAFLIDKWHDFRIGLEERRIARSFPMQFFEVQVYQCSKKFTLSGGGYEAEASFSGPDGSHYPRRRKRACERPGQQQPADHHIRAAADGDELDAELADVLCLSQRSGRRQQLAGDEVDADRAIHGQRFEHHLRHKQRATGDGTDVRRNGYADGQRQLHHHRADGQQRRPAGHYRREQQDPDELGLVQRREEQHPRFTHGGSKWQRSGERLHHDRHIRPHHQLRRQLFLGSNPDDRREHLSRTPQPDFFESHG